MDSTGPAHAALRQRVYRANLDLVKHGLVLFTWGNASAVDRAADLMLIKPSGVDYDELRPDHLVAVRLSDGAVLPGNTHKPSSDTPTHLELYRAWPQVGGIVHTHSEYATATAQAGAAIPALGTTHADYFHGDVPCTRPLTADEIAGAYEVNTGTVIIDCFAARALDPLAIPGVLIAQHGPFAWGATPEKAVYHATVLERLARMQVHTRTLNPAAARVPQDLLDRHYQRKHGPNAYYGQSGPAAK
jgi:L-ribulose-5-phosphate 4-epimerase